MLKLTIPTLVILCALLSVCGVWLYVKLSLAHDTQPFMTYWNETSSCRIDVFAPRFSTHGMVGKLVRLFSSDSFFRVYSHDGVLLRSSEWNLWQRELGQSEKAIWAGSRVIYPTSSGYRDWVIEECR